MGQARTKIRPPHLSKFGPQSCHQRGNTFVSGVRSQPKCCPEPTLEVT